MNQARATGCAWCLVPETARAGGYTHLREYEEFMNLFSPHRHFNGHRGTATFGIIVAV